MRIQYGLFDTMLENHMEDLVYAGDVSEHIFQYYSQEVLDFNLLNEITEDWTEVYLRDLLEEDQINAVIGHEEKVIELLIEDGVIKSEKDITRDSLFISEDSSGAVAWKENKTN